MNQNSFLTPVEGLQAIRVPRTVKPRVKLRLWKGALSLLLFLLVFWPKYVAFGPQGIRISPFTFLTLIMLAAVVLWLLYSVISNARINKQKAIVVSVFLMFWIVRFASDFLSGDYGTLAVTARDFIFYGVMFVLATYIGPRCDANRLYVSAARGMIIVGLLAVYEVIQERSLPGLILEQISFNISDDMTALLSSEKIRDGIFRAQSTFLHPIVLGQISAALAPICFALLLNGRGIRKLTPFLGLVGCLLGSYFCHSRSAQLALLVSFLSYVLSMFLMRRRNKSVALLYLLPVVSFALAATFGFAAYLNTGSSEAEARSSEVRSIMWERGWPMILNNPIIGYGDGRSASLAGFNTSGGGTIDDYYLTLLLDCGFLGLGLFSLFVFIILYIACKGFIVERRNRRLLASQVAAIVSILVVQKIVSIAEGTGLLFFISGMILSTVQASTTSPSKFDMQSGDKRGD